MGVMHRDLKPENFLFSGSELKATGFGLSVFIEEGLPLKSQTLPLTPNSVSSAMTREGLQGYRRERVLRGSGIAAKEPREGNRRLECGNYSLRPLLRRPPFWAGEEGNELSD